MRNTPLWRPQPSSDTASDAPGETVQRSQRFSATAMIGLGVTIAIGVGAVGALAFLDDGPVEPAVAAIVQSSPQAAPARPATGLPEVAKREVLAGRVPAKASVQPAAETIDVAVAQNELDVARLEEMTGMVAPAPVATSPAAPPTQVPPDEQPRVSATMNVDEGAVDGLRTSQTVPGAANVVVPSEPDAATSEDGTETASIQPDEAVAPVEEKPAEQQSAPALPPLSATKVNRHVNLRAGPADESRVVLVVPAGATVQAQADCGWCVVTFKGQRGYIYKSFLQRGGGATASNAPAPAVNRKTPGLY